MDIDEGLNQVAIPALHKEYGYNELPQKKEYPILEYLKSFWGPLPWLLEVLIVISMISHQVVEGSIIAILLVINSIIGAYQQRSAKSALAALTKKLSTTAHVRRDGYWQTIETRELVPGDVVSVKSGAIIPADGAVISGEGSVDVSMLTGESLPQDVSVQDQVFSGAIMKRGEILVYISAIGAATAYGKTTALLETSHPPTHMEKIIFTVIRYSFYVNLILLIIIAVFGSMVHAPRIDIINFCIVLLLTSVPVAFPAMFTIAQSYGALQMSSEAGHGVLVRRLAAVQECAMVDVICSDKTGTLTQNTLAMTGHLSYGIVSDDTLLGIAVACCDTTASDAIENAIVTYAQSHQTHPLERKNFTPFDFNTKRTKATVMVEGKTWHAEMGLPRLLLDEHSPQYTAIISDIERLSAQGLRLVAVTIRSSENAPTQCIGLLTLADPIKPDAPRIIKELEGLGIRIIMITGDGRLTAQAIATQLGLTGTVITAQDLHEHPELATTSAVIAEAYPEDKLSIVKALQAAGHTVGMTGDGVNDAPALRQAEVGIAVYTATDVAKQAASFILTHQGLEGVVKAVQLSRQVYNRLRTWAMNKIIKSIEVSLFTTLLFFITHSYILSPLLAVLLIFANDFVTMAMATDHTTVTARPSRWNIKRFTIAACIIAFVPFFLLLCVYTVAAHQGYSINYIRTIIYLALIFLGKANLYAIRAWPHGWSVKPSAILVYATLFSLAFALAVSLTGILIPAITITIAAIIVGVGILNFFLVDSTKDFKTVRMLFHAQ